jgi:ketosteroid isomerase-like protein
MKNSASVRGIIACALILSGMGLRCAFAADAQTEITRLEHKCTAAPTADAFFACFEDSDELVVYDLTPPREFRGGKAVHEDFRQICEAFRNPKFQFITLHVIADGELGVSESIQHMSATDKNGKPIDFIFRETDVWRKGPSGWKILHTHVSVPVDMATGRAELHPK